MSAILKLPIRIDGSYVNIKDFLLVYTSRWAQAGSRGIPTRHFWQIINAMDCRALDCHTAMTPTHWKKHQYYDHCLGVEASYCRHYCKKNETKKKPQLAWFFFHFGAAIIV